MLSFACLSPHPPIILPNIGSPEDREKVKSTVIALESLAAKLAAAKPEIIVISSPHPDWGVEVPLYFLTKELKTKNIKLKTYLTGFESPKKHFEKGKEIIRSLPRSASGRRGAWIASGDMSHRLKEDGPYGLHPSGPKFDKKFIELLKKKDIRGILNLDPDFVEEAGECGLRSFCMLLGALEAAKVSWKPKILSYEGPFGVGYLVVRLV